MDGLKLVINRCSSLKTLACDHRQNADLALSARLEIELVIYRVVEQLLLNNGQHFLIVETEGRPCELEWKCHGRLEDGVWTNQLLN